MSEDQNVTEVPAAEAPVDHPGEIAGPQGEGVVIADAAAQPVDIVEGQLRRAAADGGGAAVGAGD